MTSDANRPPNPVPYSVSVFGSTNVGVVRTHNEDNFLVADLTAGLCNLQPEVRNHDVGDLGSLFMVADGMGGGAAGEVASQLAINTIYQHFLDTIRSQPDLPKTVFARQLRHSVAYTNGVIFEESQKNPDYKGMGTTLSAAGFLRGTLYLAQVGDSRAYLIRQETIKQVTKDQSLVNKLLDAGLITEEEAETHENKNVILQALGVSNSVDVVLSSIDIRRNDVLVLCSDGLSGLVRSEEICSVVTQVPDQVAACKVLIDMANERGGHDNITVIIVRFTGDALPIASPDDVVQYTLFEDPGEDTSEITGSPTASVEKKKLTESDASPRNKTALVWVGILAVVVAGVVYLATRGGSGPKVPSVSLEASAPQKDDPSDTVVPVVPPSAPIPEDAAAVSVETAPVVAPSTTAIVAGNEKKAAVPESQAKPESRTRDGTEPERGNEKAVSTPAAETTIPFKETSIGRDNQSEQPRPPASATVAAATSPVRPADEQPSKTAVLMPGRKEERESDKAMAPVEVVSEPPGIPFTIDDQDTTHATPAKLQLTVGQHTLTFRLGPILVRKEITVRADTDNRFPFLVDTLQKTVLPPP